MCDDDLDRNNNRNGDRLAQVLCRMMWYIRGGDYQPDGTKDSSYETSEILLDDVSFSLMFSSFFENQIEKVNFCYCLGMMVSWFFIAYQSR